MRLVYTSTPKPHSRSPQLTAREFRDGSGWYVFVFWGDAPAEQVGSFPNEAEAQEWIDKSGADWVKTFEGGAGPE